MTWRLAETDDIPQIEAHLTAHIETSMFPLLNLREHWLGDRTSPRAMMVWISQDGGILAITNEGMLMPQITSRADLSAAADLLRGRKIVGALGHADQVRALVTALRLPMEQASLNRDEPLMTLHLSDLTMPDAPGMTLAPLQDHRDLVRAWRIAYDIEILGATPDSAEARVDQNIDSYIERDSHRVLLHDGTPVATTGFNTILPEAVQIGGVFTPPEMRGRGYARRAVALHLDQARQAGTPRAILFSASENANRAYHAIGFQTIGSYTLALFNDPVTVP